MSYKLQKLLLILVAGGAIMVGYEGCGGSEAAEISTSSLSKAAFIKKADAICSSTETQIALEFAAYRKQHGPPTEGSLGVDGVQAVIVPSLLKEIDEINKLGAPRGDKEQVEDFLNTMRGVVDTIEKERIASGGTLYKAFKPVAEVGSKYGFKQC